MEEFRTPWRNRPIQCERTADLGAGGGPTRPSMQMRVVMCMLLYVMFMLLHRDSAPSQLSSVKAAAPRCGRAGGAAAMRTSPRPSRQRRPIVRGGRPGACLRLLLPATRSLAPLLGGGGRVGRPCVVQPAVGGRSAQAGGSDALVQSCADVEARAEQRGRLERRALHLADACSLRVRTGCRSTSPAVARSVSRGCVVRAAPAPPGWR